jgi:hypothetical protein
LERKFKSWDANGDGKISLEELTVRPAKRYAKKPRQGFVSSSLDSLGLSAAVTHVFVCKRLV